MKTPAHSLRTKQASCPDWKSQARFAARPGRAAFSLLELIAVLAIMAVMASVLAPNVLRSVDEAAVRAEAGNLQRLGEQVTACLRASGATPAEGNPLPPTVPQWTLDLAGVSEFSATDILQNRRGVRRVYLTDLPVTPRRALILSNLRNDAALALPGTATAAQFDEIWNTADGSAPVSWGAAWASQARFLLIERVQLGALRFDVRLNNNGSAPVRYEVFSSNGTPKPPPGTVPNGTAPGNPAIVPVVEGDRIDLRDALNNLDASYVLTRARTFDFEDATGWRPQP